MLITFFKNLKEYTYKSSKNLISFQILKNLAQFFADHLFQILKKLFLQILQKPGRIFRLQRFSDIKISILRNRKETWPNFLILRFLNIQKNYTYISGKNLGQFFAYLLFEY